MCHFRSIKYQDFNRWRSDFNQYCVLKKERFCTNWKKSKRKNGYPKNAATNFFLYDVTEWFFFAFSVANCNGKSFCMNITKNQMVTKSGSFWMLTSWYRKMRICFMYWTLSSATDPQCIQENRNDKKIVEKFTRW